MKKLLLLVTMAAFGLVSCSQQPTTSTPTKPEQPKFEVKVAPEGILSIRYDDKLLREAKAAYQANDPAFMSLFNTYKQNVDRNYLNIKAASVAENVIHLAPTKDPRDYITLSPYWWPDPDTDDGMPYVRSDGVRNPEVNDYPGRTLGSDMSTAAENLAFMYFMTGDEKYAAKATEIIRKWYLDPVTGQNANLVFAQYVPGMERIRGTGLLESARAVGALSAATLMVDSQSWTDEDEAALQDWATAYLYWMEYSTHGQEEHKGGNNHAMWYETNRQAFTLYVKDYDHLADIIVKYQFPRLSEQIAADSTMPHEIARTLGLHYTTFVLSSVAQTSIMAEKIGMTDVWSYVGPNGRGMLWGLDFIIPYWQAPDTWPYMQISPAREGSIPHILFQAYKGTGIERYKDLAEEIGFTGMAASRGVGINNLLYYKLKR